MAKNSQNGALMCLIKAFTMVLWGSSDQEGNLHPRSPEMECHFSVWGGLAFLSLALVVSLILNILHCMKKKQAKKHKDYEENNPSYGDYPTEDYPVYGNLNQDILEECCYEQMKSQPQRPINQLQVESANQMCYASLDHSVNGKRRKPRRKKGEDEEERSSNPMVASKASIYLNSEQLAAENTAKVEAIHDDPIRLMGLIHNSKGENQICNEPNM